MKTIQSKLAILFMFCVCYSCENENLQQAPDTCFPNVGERYSYPIVPGSEKWQELSSTDEAFQVCQIPDDILKSISTQVLIDAIAYNPMFVGQSFLSSSATIETWHNLYARLNGVQELLNRHDSGEALVAYYKAIDFGCINSKEDYPSTEFERLSGIEFLFTKEEILNNMSHQKKQELIEALLSNYSQNKGRGSVIVPMAWIMYHDNYQPMMEYYTSNETQYEQSILMGYVASEEQSKLIISIAYTYIN